MRVLGVDPGTIKMGLGVVDSISGDLMSPYHGVIAPRRKDPLENRLAHLFEATKKVIEETQPDAIAIEEPFVSKNPKTGIAIGQAQAVVFIAGAQKDIPVFRYAPQEVKKSVTNYGGSSKEQVGEMVSLLLGGRDIKGPDDVTDALAVAICHINSHMLDDLIGSSTW